MIGFVEPKTSQPPQLNSGGKGHLRQRNCRYPPNRHTAAEIHCFSTKCRLFPTDALFRNIVLWTTELMSDLPLEKRVAAWRRRTLLEYDRALDEERVKIGWREVHEKQPT